MKPPRFAYVDPTDADEAIAFLSDHADDTKILAGGQSLMPVLAMRLVRPSYVVDVNRIEALDYIHVHDGAVHIGALTRQSALAESEAVRRHCPLVIASLPFVGHEATRCRGTLGGTIVHADPAAELPAAMVALDATFVLRGPRGERTVPADDFFFGYFTTELQPDELLTEVRIPAQPEGARTAVREIARRHGDFALAGILAALTLDGGATVTSARLAAIGVADRPLRLREAEALLTGASVDDDVLSAAAERATVAVSPESDMHASADYRRRMTGVLLRRAVGACLDGQAA
jgi:carbon-monoxide dehydrogenase medium subunit